jgi:hypothetical protein
MKVIFGGPDEPPGLLRDLLLERAAGRRGAMLLPPACC